MEVCVEVGIYIGLLRIFCLTCEECEGAEKERDKK